MPFQSTAWVTQEAASLQQGTQGKGSTVGTDVVRVTLAPELRSFSGRVGGGEDEVWSHVL